MIQPSRILVAGASRLPEEFLPFARELGRALMANTNFILVTGGLKRRNTETEATDFIVADASKAELKQRNESASSRIITMLPESDVPSFTRFRIGSVLGIEYSNPNTRRFSMALTSDALITINGGKETGEIIDLAYASGKILIPIPATGGRSYKRWKKYKTELVKRLGVTPDEIAGLEDASNSKEAIRICLSLLQKVLRPQCFVAMDFSDHPMPLTYETIQSVIEAKGYRPVRIDQENFSGSIVEAIWDAIRAADIAVVDLTNQKPNVYYELGICHALTKPTVLTIFDKAGEVPNDIPFDIKAHRILPFGTKDSLSGHLKKHVPDVSNSTSTKP